jgi:3-phosphoshikimate 1-carboxyvinyltransferase
VPLPDLIEIIPPAKPASAQVTVPGSKSITNRALILAALAEGETVLRGALWSEDTQVMVECLQELGFMINVAPDPAETCNRTLTVYGRGGQVPSGGTAAQPLELFVGNAGTAARFLAAFVCLGGGFYRLHGVPRMHERPQAALFNALRELGYDVDSPTNKLPAVIRGVGPRRGKCKVTIDESSQFASALLLGARRGGWEVSVQGVNAEESPYVAMTSKLVEAFSYGGGPFQIEPDASSGSYFLAASYLLGMWRGLSAPAPAASQSQPLASSEISVAAWPVSDWQVDSAFPAYLPLPDTLSRQSDLGDSILTAMVLAPFSSHPVRFTDLGRLRLQECERVAAFRNNLTRCGAKVIEADDTLTIEPGTQLHGAEIETYDDHRVAMCFAILGLRVPEVRIRNPLCVKKTFPDFFQKLASPPPYGLNATIRDPRTGHALEPAELFAG